MARRKNINLTDHISYRIIDNTIYLFQNNDKIDDDEMELLYKKVSLIIEDNDISYINISARNIEQRKELYQNLGFSLSYYDVNKLNLLYTGEKNKKEYRCYGIMTKKDFFDSINSRNIIDVGEKRVINSNSGFVYNMFLLFTGIIFLCYLCVQGAIYLVK